MTDAELDMEPTRQILAVFAAFAPSRARPAPRATPRPCPTCGGERHYRRRGGDRDPWCEVCDPPRQREYERTRKRRGVR